MRAAVRRSDDIVRFAGTAPAIRFPRSWTGLLCLAFVLLLAACGDDDNPPPDDPPVAMIRGQIEQGGGYIGAPGELAPEGLPAPAHLIGAIVTVERIDDDGNFVDVTRDTAVSDQNGRFVVTVEADVEANLVVAAVRDNESYRALVSHQVKADSTVVVAPLNDETTAEAEVWADIQDRPEAAMVQRVEVSLAVNSLVASVAITSDELVPPLARSIVGLAEAQRAFHLASEIGTNVSRLEDARVDREKALLRLDEDLDVASENSVATIHVYDAFFQREREAWTANGIPPHVLAVAREAGMREYNRRAADARIDLMRYMAGAAGLQRARTTAAAVDTLLEMAGLGAPALATVTQAGVTLRNEMYNAASDAGIRIAFNQYADAVVPVMAAAFPGTAANVQLARATLVAPGGQKDKLMSLIATASTAQFVAETYAEYLDEAVQDAAAVLADGEVPVAARQPYARALMLLVMGF